MPLPDANCRAGRPIGDPSQTGDQLGVVSGEEHRAVRQIAAARVGGVTSIERVEIGRFQLLDELGCLGCYRLGGFGGQLEHQGGGGFDVGWLLNLVRSRNEQVSIRAAKTEGTDTRQPPFGPRGDLGRNLQSRTGQFNMRIERF